MSICSFPSSVSILITTALNSISGILDFIIFFSRFFLSWFFCLKHLSLSSYFIFLCLCEIRWSGYLEGISLGGSITPSTFAGRAGAEVNTGRVFFQSVQALTALVGGRAGVRGSRTRASYIGFLLCLMFITGQLGSRGHGVEQKPWRSCVSPGCDGSLCLGLGHGQFLKACVYLSGLISLFPQCMYMLSHVWLFVTPWTVAYQASLSMGFSRQEYQSGLPCMPPGGSSHQGSSPHRLCLLHRQEGPLPLAPTGKPFTSACTLIKGCYSATPLN